MAKKKKKKTTTTKKKQRSKKSSKPKAKPKKKTVDLEKYYGSMNLEDLVGKDIEYSVISEGKGSYYTSRLVAVIKMKETNEVYGIIVQKVSEEGRETSFIPLSSLVWVYLMEDLDDIKIPKKRKKRKKEEEEEEEENGDDDGDDGEDDDEYGDDDGEDDDEYGDDDGEDDDEYGDDDEDEYE